jgi:hypothetical protein
MNKVLLLLVLLLVMVLLAGISLLEDIYLLSWLFKLMACWDCKTNYAISIKGHAYLEMDKEWNFLCKVYVQSPLQEWG